MCFLGFLTLGRKYRPSGVLYFLGSSHIPVQIIQIIWLQFRILPFEIVNLQVKSLQIYWTSLVAYGKWWLGVLYQQLNDLWYHIFWPVAAEHKTSLSFMMSSPIMFTLDFTEGVENCPILVKANKKYMIYSRCLKKVSAA